MFADNHATSTPRDGDAMKVGYVMKVYPRLSETFIVNEILAHERAGLRLDLFSLRQPADPRTHPNVAKVESPVTYLAGRVNRGSAVWDELRRAAQRLPGWTDHLDMLLQTDVREAVAALDLATHVTARGITHLHAHFGSASATVTRLAARLAGVTYSFTAHAKDIYHESVDPADLGRKVADAARVVTVSNFNVDHLAAAFPTTRDQVVRIYNGLDLTEFPYAPPANRERLVLGVGRLVEKKGFSDLLRALRLLSERGEHAKAVIVGDGELAGDLRRECTGLGLDDLVTFTGPLPQHQVRELMQSAAVMAAPCVVGSDGNRDGLPTVLLEAMALGTPCVATDVTGIPELVEHGKTGLLVNQRDPVQLSQALSAVLTDHELAEGLAQRARARIDTDFDVERQAHALRGVFQEAAGNAASAPPAPVKVAV